MTGHCSCAVVYNSDSDVCFIVDSIEKTINYEDIYEISAFFMAKKYKLLESVAFDIASEIKIRFDQVKKVKVSLSKLNPKLPGKVGAARVDLEL